jgi:NADPH-dependent 2,4-dienoyl-CoA reductase/sulfur reductase-like enzyme/rhodanese-related sulfurtransferase
MSDSKRVLIVGGVAGGATCAARLRRLDENARILVFERGPHVSVATCGLPYWIGDVIQEEGKLLQATPEVFARNFNIEVRAAHEVTAIDRTRAEIEVRELDSGRLYREPYDALVLAPGAMPIRPALPGMDLPGIFALRSLTDSQRIREWIASRAPRRAVIAGAGFIGLEMAENLTRRGLKVTVAEALPQVLPALDPEMAEPLGRHLETHRVDLRLGDGVAGFESASGGSLVVLTASGQRLAADLVLLAMGVRPEARLAEAAGLEIGTTGGIRVDEQMRTCDPKIWAVGDAVEVRDLVTGAWRLAPLAGLAHRQARVAADAICGRSSRFRGAQATAACGVFGMTAALTGATEKSLRCAGISAYEVAYLHPGDHAGYYPGATPVHLKLIFTRPEGRLLGAQAVGEQGAEKRIDVLSMATQQGATVFDLEQAEFCYAPQFGSAKDPVNLAGMTAANMLRGDLAAAPWPELASTGALLVDVREPHEFAADHIEGALNLPLSQLRRRFEELPRDREIWLYCEVGQRSYYALRFLEQKGFNVRSLLGGYQTYWGLYP